MAASPYPAYKIYIPAKSAQPGYEICRPGKRSATGLETHSGYSGVVMPDGGFALSGLRDIHTRKERAAGLRDM